MNSYVVKYKRIEDGWWLATVDGVPGCLTQGRTINQTRRRIREALSLFVDHADTAKLIDNIQLSAKVQQTLNQFNIVRKRANEEIVRLQDSANKAVTLLTEGTDMSMRDAAELLGLSHQRVHQILHRSTGKKGK
jgi:predicted RNase H-like HicB family nuclease